MAIEKKEQIVVGVNAFQSDEKIELERVKQDPAIEANQRAALADIRSRRDQGKAAELMGTLSAAARTKENLMPLLITCVEADLTLGEICGVLRKVWGEYQPPVWG